MPVPERPSPERIRALIEEADRVRRETESIADVADHAMKQGKFWPDRRKACRFPRSESGRGADDDDGA